ncbi:diaminopimelate epimerase [Streptomyces sp. NPDC053048]|uniref:diaminopimelate epimerase n=1 Tax=Streptomyces sp. NPDC053048 TaxID=3365694 RepID=UPI0037CD52E2
MSRSGVGPGPRYAKGYCGGNGFLIVLDPDNRLFLSEAAVRALCDPYTGLGGDGVLRLVRTARAGMPGRSRSEWFMDCRHRDGSQALMCDPGLGLAARYLTLAGLALPGRMWIGTRAGDQRAVVDSDGRATMELPPPRLLGPSSASVDGHDLQGTAVSLGNLHLVCVLETPVAHVDLTRDLRMDLAPIPRVTGVIVPDVNLSLVNVLPDRSLRLRVHQPGVGEARSCGAAVCAAAAAVQHTAGEWGTTVVESEPGPLSVTLEPNAPALLTGAAGIAAEGVLDARWLATL